MKFTSRILIAVLMALCLSLVNVSAKQQTAGNLESDLLISLDIADEAFYSDGNAVLKRKEAAMLLSLLAKATAGSETELEGIKDVSTQTEYADYIAACVRDGYLSTGNMGNFNPDSDIKYGEFLHGVVNLLHHDIIRSSGRTDLNIAEKYKYSIPGKGASNSITRYDAALIMYKALEAPYPELGSVSAEGEISLDFDSGRTLLSEVFEVEKIKGVITDNGISALYSESEISEDCIMLNNTVYKKGQSKAELFLGYYVVCYVTIDSGNNVEKVIMLYSDQDNETTNIPIKLLKKLERSTNGTIAISYDYKNNTKKLTLDKETPIIKNGVASSLENGDDIYLQNGNLTVLKRKDGSYVLFVDVYTTVIVDRISPKDYRLSDLITGKSYDFDTDDDDRTVRIIKNEEEIAFAKLKNGDVMELYINNYGGKESITGIVSSDTHVGKISGIDSDEKTVTMGNDVFDVENSYMNTVLNSASIKSGKYATVYFDAHGQVAYIEIAKQEGEYGYLLNIRAVEDIDGAVEERIMVKMMDMEGTVASYFMTEKVRSNDGRIKAVTLLDNNNIYNAQNSYATIQQLVKYSTNSDGEISEFYIAKKGHDTSEFTVDEEGILYKRIGDIMGGLYRISGTKLLLVPKQSFPADILRDEKNFEVITAYFEDDKSYDVSLYDCGDDYRPAVIVIHSDEFGKGAQVDTDVSPTMIVKGITIGLDEDDQQVYQLKGFVGGVSVKLTLTDNELDVEPLEFTKSVVAERKTVTDLKFGDIITYSTDTRGRISGIRVLYTPSDVEWEIFERTSQNYDDAYSNIGVVTATVEDVQSDAIFYRTENDRLRMGRIGEGTPVLCCDLEGKTIEKISANSLGAGEKIFLRTHYGAHTTYAIVVYR